MPLRKRKKNKHSHLKQQNSAQAQKVPTSKAPITFEDLLAAYNSVQILGLLGALQLHPGNHGRSFRFEQLCLATLRQFNPDDERSLASWEQLKEVIEGYRDGAMMEYPLSNAFTETAVFEEGNYIVYPGIYDGFTDSLNHLTECIFLHSHGINKDFVKTVGDAIGLLLFMSDSVAREAGHSTHIFQSGKSGNIEFPEYEKAVKYTEAIYFTRAYLKEVCEAAKYDINILNDFLIQPGSKELEEDDPDENVVNFKPLLKSGIIFYFICQPAFPTH